LSEESAPAIEWPNWPTVPACYGWLSLDRRGNWRLKGELVRHPGLVAYLNTRYVSDAAGNWLVNNGPQAVYVRLDYVPLVWRLSEGQLFAHAGQVSGTADSVYVDEGGNILLTSSARIGLLHDLDLADFARELCNDQGQLATDEELATASQGYGELRWHGFPLVSIRSGDVAGHFGFNPDPQP